MTQLQIEEISSFKVKRKHSDIIDKIDEILKGGHQPNEFQNPKVSKERYYDAMGKTSEEVKPSDITQSDIVGL